MSVDVWLLDIRTAARREPRLSVHLADDELDRASRFLRSVDALRYRVAHGALRVILSDSTGVQPRRIRFSYGARGKPFLPDGGPRFSLSHGGALVLIAVTADLEVGVDVEELRPFPRAAELLGRHASAETARLFGDRFMHAWTAMEATVKVDGRGLADGLDRFEIRDAGGQRARAWIAGSPAAACSIRWLTPAPRHIGAVAVRGGHPAVRLRRFA